MGCAIVSGFRSLRIRQAGCAPVRRGASAIGAIQAGGH
jgi:hypothetical protein